VIRWLIIALLVSIVGLLLAAAGVARHILRQRIQLKHRASKGDAAVVDAPEKADMESEN
jgi:hypothetical protein